MRRFFHRRGVWILAVAVILSVGAFALTVLLGGTATPLTEVARVVTQPAERAFGAATEQVDAVKGYFVERKSLQEENEQLRKTIADLKTEAREGAAAAQENTRLRELLGLREKRRELTFESAKVRDRCATNWSSALTIDKGSQHGVKVRDCVVDATGSLLGVVGEVGQTWATVLTVVDASVEWGAQVVRTGDTAVLEGDFALMLDGRLKLTYLKQDSNLIVGDEILTFATEGVYPSGLMVGVVEEIRTDETGMSRYAIIQPAVDLSKQSQVFVIKSFEIVD